MDKHEILSIEETQSSFWGFFINNWRVTLLLLLMFTFGGVLALYRMPLESSPEVKIPIAVVSAVYPGASPADMEKLVTDRLEDKIKNLDNLKEFTSSSSEGISMITVQFNPQADLTDSIRKLRDEVTNAKSNLPDDAMDPVVTEIRLDDISILTVSLLANLPPEEMKQYSDDLKDVIEGVSGVSEAILSGLSDKEMQVLIDIQKLEGYGISLPQVVSVLTANHVDYPIGSLLTNGYYYQASLKGQFDAAEDLLQLPVGSAGGENIYLRDIATVREVFGETQSEARVYRAAEKDFRDSVTLQIKKKTGANIVNVVDTVKEKVTEFKQKSLPPSVDVLLTNDYSEFVREDISTLGETAIETILIIFVVLFLSLGLVETILVSLSVPLILLVSFIGLSIAGETFNSIVMFALVLSLGIVVDNSIVIVQAIYRNVKMKHMGGGEAALLAISEFKAPLVAGTLTIMAAFFPMTMMTGIMGEYIRHLPNTVNITLAASFLTAVFLLAALCARVFRDYHGDDKREYKEAILTKYFLKHVEAWYAVKIRHIMESKKLRRTWVICMVTAFFITVTFPIVGLMKVQMFPTVDQDYFNVAIKLPTGAQLEDTDSVAKEVEAMVEKLPELDNFVTIVGGGAVASSSSHNTGGGSSTSSNQGAITVNLTKKDTRELKSYDIAAMLRKETEKITDATISVEELQSGPTTGAPVDVQLKGTNLNVLEATSVKVKAALEKIAGTRDVTSDVETGTGEFHFTPRRDRLNYYGLTTIQLASALRTAVYGNNSVKILRSGEETPIVISLDFRSEACKNDKQNQLLEKRDNLTLCRNNPENISQLENLLIATSRGTVPVSELAEITLNPAITTIRHRDGDTVVSVKSYTDTDTLPSVVVAKLQAEIAPLLPEGVTASFGGETEDVTESFQSLFSAMGVGLFMIALILVFQFNSFRQPFIIIFTIPLALIGVFSSLTLLGRNFSFPGFIGIVALCGIVVSHTIILTDRFNYHIKRGMEKIEAIVLACKERLEPVFLTTAATVVGMIPLAFTNEMWTDLALTIAFGLTFCTLLTLVMVPIFYNTLVNDDEIKHMR